LKKWLSILSILVLFVFANKANGQLFTQTFIDKCTGQTKVATTTMVNGNAIVSFYGQIKSFTPVQVTSGELQTWLQVTYASYNSLACPVSTPVVTQTVTQAVSQAASTAASTAASAASGAASSAASASASSASTSGASSSSQSSSSSSQSSSSGGESSSSSSSTESKSESSSSSESKSESKEESKSESKEEKKEEKKKEDKKKEERQIRLNPILVNSDLTTVQNPAGGFVPIVSLGMSQGSATGESSWGLSSMIYADLKSFALSANRSEMVFDKGALKAIKAYSYTYAWMNGIPMTFGGYTYIKPHPKYGVMGYNLSLITIKLKGTDSYSYQFASSTTAFWTKPYQLNKKATVSPGVFIMSSPYSYNTATGGSWNYNIAGLVGTGFTYQISKRFVFSADWKINASTAPGSPILNFFMIGTRAMF
jgi:hypothetical protein